MIARIVKGVLESYGVDQKMVDKIKSIVDNIDVQEVGDQICVDISLKKVKIIIEKDKREGEE
jgi:hypothetical protein